MVVWTVRCPRPLIAWVREGEETGVQQGSGCLTGSGLLSASRSVPHSGKREKVGVEDALDIAGSPFPPPLLHFELLASSAGMKALRH